MIYIVGFTFQFRNQLKPISSSGSIQEKMALAHNRTNQTRQTSVFDSRFILNDTYKVSRIQKKYEDDTTYVQYLFTNTSRQADDIDIRFPSTTSGDEYIAAISSQTQKLAEEREAIAKAMANQAF